MTSLVEKLSLIRSLYSEVSDQVFTVSDADDCFVITSLSANPFNPMFDLVDVALVSKHDLTPIKMLEQSSTESLLVYADVKRKVTAWLLLIQSTAADFPINTDDQAVTEYYKRVGAIADAEEWED